MAIVSLPSTAAPPLPMTTSDAEAALEAAPAAPGVAPGVASNTNGNWHWECGNSPEVGHHVELACLCRGEGLLGVPTQLHPGVQRLTMSHTGMEVLTRKALLLYNNTLSDVELLNLRMLTNIEPGTFSSLGKLRAVYIAGAPKLQSLPSGVFSNLALSFRVLRIIHTGLHVLPELNGLGANSILHMIDFESNKIQRISSSSLKVRAEQVLLEYNSIEVVEANAFNGSEIAKLSLKGNRKLTQLSLAAFKGLKSIRELDLSSTSITQLPTEGLEELDALRVEDTPTLREVPSIYSFKHLQVAHLTYSFHCCAFRFPARHDPERHRKHQLYLERISRLCSGAEGERAVDAVELKRLAELGVLALDDMEVPGADTAYSYQADTSIPTGLVDDYSAMGGAHWADDNDNPSYWDTGQISGDPAAGTAAGKETRTGRARRLAGDHTMHPDLVADGGAFGNFGGILPEDGFQRDYEQEKSIIGEEDHGSFGRHNTPLDSTDWHTQVTPPRRLHALCGNLSISRVEVRCSPAPDALNPCEDIMGYAWLRVFVWAVVAATVAGNLAVLAVLLANVAALTVPKFLMCHLALADLCMGLYLLLVAAMDLRSSGEYFNFACAWQIEVGCNVAGFLTVFSSQLSIFTLCVITLERWFAITYAIDLNKRLRLGAAANVMAAGWVYALTMAALPLAGVSSYSSTSICLPMDSSGAAGLSYLLFLLLMAGLAFTVVLVCYLQIYLSLGPETRRRKKRRRPPPPLPGSNPGSGAATAAHTKASRTELSVANKMALLVFTDFTCWAPIAFFSLTALAGHPLISVTNSKILLVFFYPLNACANPFLYAILTAQYRRDLCVLLSRYGICTRLAQRYKMAAHSSPTTNNSHQPMPLAGRCDGCPEYRSSLLGGMPNATRTSRLLSVDQANSLADSRDEAFV